MYCLKCGRDTTEERVFCDSCLEIMEHYPIKSDAAVSLPHRDTEQSFRKVSRKRSIPPEEQVLHLRKSIRRLKALIVLLLLLLGLAGALLVQTQMRHYDTQSSEPTEQSEDW